MYGSSIVEGMAQTITQTPIDAFVQRMQDPRMAATLQVQSVALQAIHRFLHDEGITQLMPVMLSPVTDPLNHPVHDSSIEYMGQKLELTRSMILHKQAAMLTGVPGLYIMSPNVRLEQAECASSGRHLIEFTQVDIELPGADKDTFMDLIERMVVHVMQSVQGEAAEALAVLGRSFTVPSLPFERIESASLRDQPDWEAKASKERDAPFWVMDHEREFYDKEDPDRPGYYHNYDLVWPEGFGEALSGAERDHEHDVLMRKIHARDQDPQDFASYLELARAGHLQASAGGGMGIERLVRYLTGAKHVADVMPFPRVPGQAILL